MLPSQSVLLLTFLILWVPCSLQTMIRQVALVFQLECLAVVLTCMQSAFTATATPRYTAELV